MAQSYNDLRWIKGINSLLESSLLQEGQFAWAQNTDNAGGIIHVRQGFSVIGSRIARLPALEPKGMAVFKDKLGKIAIVIAIGAEFWACYAPFNQDFFKIGDGFTSKNPVIFQRAFVYTELKDDGTLEFIPPYAVLIAQNGLERARYWDGATWQTSDPSLDHPGIPVGKWMQWSGGRLWVASGHALHASDLGNPLSFFEETYVAGGGALFFEDEITGMNQTPNLQSLLVSTDFNTSVVQSAQLDRTQWGSTPDFQKVFLPGIGCAAGKSYVRQWGMVWWMSPGGLICLDQALNTYRTSRIHYKDQEMMRSKGNKADDISGIASGAFGNYLLVAVPSGDTKNAHTWVMNQRVIESGDVEEPAEWASNWIGLHPIEFVTTVINGKQRMFALSREDGDAGQDFYPNVWELFTGERQDRFNEHTFYPPCQFETRLLGMTENLATFRYAELDLAEIIGKVNIQVFVASRRGGYHQILDKDIVATEGSINSNATATYLSQTTSSVITGATTIPVVTTTGSLPAPALLNIDGQSIKYTAKSSTVFTVDPTTVTNNITSGTQVAQPQFAYPYLPTIVTSFLPQRRMLRTSEWNIKANEPTTSTIETNLGDNIDRGFSILVKWTGRMAITALRIFTAPFDDQKMGKCEDNELNTRFVGEDGGGTLSETIEDTTTTDSGKKKSQFIQITTPRHLDDFYRPLPSEGVV